MSSPKPKSVLSLAPRGKHVSVQPPSGSVRKTVDALAIVPTRDRLTVLARKVYNVMLFHAQHQGADQPIFKVRLRDVIHALEFNSNNTEILKEHLRQMVTTKVEWQSPSTGEGARWGVSALIAHAEIYRESGEVMLEWSYAPTIKAALLDPDRYARISLAFQSSLKSMSALVLYEICARYVDNPGGVTARQHWTWWRPVLTGVPEGQGGAYDEWKYFKRDVIKPAVAEVNAQTDLLVEAIEYRRGRAVTDLQFRVARKEAVSRPLAALMSPVSLEDVGRAIACGVPQERAERMLAKFGERCFAKGVRLLEARRARANLEPIRSAEKFLLAVLSNTLEQSQPELPAMPPGREQKAARVALLERYREHQRLLAEALFQESSDSAQAEVIAQFETEVIQRSDDALRRTYERKGAAAPLTRALFRKFLAQRMLGQHWELPTDSQLLEFAMGQQEGNSPPSTLLA